MPDCRLVPVERQRQSADFRPQPFKIVWTGHHPATDPFTVGLEMFRLGHECSMSCFGICSWRCVGVGLGLH